ncbi:unnamed protein product, partial [marine sediment metagenome]
YPGKTSGLEINDLRRAEFNESPGMFKIFMMHTMIDKARGDLPVDALEISKIPFADYYALGHLHIDFQYENFVYPGPIFPNNFKELEDLEHGRFCIIDTELDTKNQFRKIELKMKEVVSFDIKIENALLATEKIISELEKKDLDDKIVLLRLRGILETGKNSDIKFSPFLNKELPLCPGCKPNKANSIPRSTEVFPQPMSPDNKIEPSGNIISWFL